MCTIDHASRRLWLNQTIDDNVAQQICAALLAMTAADKDKPIRVYINSPGGTITSAYMIINMMMSAEVTPPVWTTGLGMCYSAATLLLAAGEPGNRVVLEDTTLMIHKLKRPGPVVPASMSTNADDEQLEREAVEAQLAAAELKRKQERFLDKYVELTGQPKEKLRQDLANDNYMSADEAVAYGLADMVRARKPRPLTASHATEPAEADAAAADDDVTES